MEEIHPDASISRANTRHSPILEAIGPPLNLDLVTTQQDSLHAAILPQNQSVKQLSMPQPTSRSPSQDYYLITPIKPKRTNNSASLLPKTILRHPISHHPQRLQRCSSHITSATILPIPKQHHTLHHPSPIEIAPAPRTKVTPLHNRYPDPNPSNVAT